MTYQESEGSTIKGAAVLDSNPHTEPLGQSAVRTIEHETRGYIGVIGDDQALIQKIPTVSPDVIVTNADKVLARADVAIAGMVWDSHLNGPEYASIPDALRKEYRDEDEEALRTLRTKIAMHRSDGDKVDALIRSYTEDAMRKHVERVGLPTYPTPEARQKMILEVLQVSASDRESRLHTGFDELLSMIESRAPGLLPDALEVRKGLPLPPRSTSSEKLATVTEITPKIVARLALDLIRENSRSFGRKAISVFTGENRTVS